MTTISPISAVLGGKPPGVWSISPESTVFEAIQLMADKNVGALLVLAGQKLEGIISERDYTRKVILRGKSSKQTLVREIMANPVITAPPSATVEECMRIMTGHRIRHLPVVEGEKVVGVVSIGDLVNWTISAQQHHISHLESYISGQYPG